MPEQEKCKLVNVSPAEAVAQWMLDQVEGLDALLPATVRTQSACIQLEALKAELNRRASLASV